MIDLQIDRPIPMPRALVVNIGLKMRLRLTTSIPLPVSAIETSTALCSFALDVTDSTRGSAAVQKIATTIATTVAVWSK
jgi:hypothetical protein